MCPGFIQGLFHKIESRGDDEVQVKPVLNLSCSGWEGDGELQDERPRLLRMAPCAHLYLVWALLVAPCSLAQELGLDPSSNTSCAEALQQFLARVAPVFDRRDTSFCFCFCFCFYFFYYFFFTRVDKSLTLELVEMSDFSISCRTPFYSVELWRVSYSLCYSLCYSWCYSWCYY